MENIYSAIDSATVISFDVFDTLLLRPFSDPKDLFAYIEEKGYTGFKNDRISAENKVRRKHEPTIDEIYSLIPKYSECQAVELEVEKKLLYVNQQVKKIYEYACKKGKTIIIISDMYLSSDFLDEVLRENGYDSHRKIYVSCEYNMTKRDGSLYDKVLNEFPLNQNRILHIGDNILSDYSEAKKRGITAIHLPKAIDKYFQYRPYRTKDTQTLSGSIFVKFCAERWNFGFDNYWEQFGYEIAGPICFSFTKWVFDTIQKKFPNTVDLLFVARDGYILEQIFKVLERNITTVVKKTHYFYAPRVISSYCSILKKKDINKLTEQEKKTVANFLANNCDIAGKLDKSDNDLYLQENASLVYEKIENALEEFADYLTTEIIDKNKVVIVDTRTENFSAQSVLEYIIGEDTKPIGLYYVVGGENNSFSFESFQLEKQNVYLCWQAIEFIMSAPTPSIVAVRNGAPVYAELNEYEKERIALFKEIEKGVLEFVNDLEERSLLSITPPETVVRNWFNQFCVNGDKKDRKEFSDVKFAHNVSHSEYIQLSMFNNSDRNTSTRDRVFRWLTLHPNMYSFIRRVYLKAISIQKLIKRCNC